MPDYDLKTLTGVTGKVDKVSGKGLSTNDFSDDYKTKIDISKTVGVAVTSSNSSDVYTATITGVQYTHGVLIMLLNNRSTVNNNNCKLNINNLGAKPIYYKNRAIKSGEFPYRNFRFFMYTTWNHLNEGNGAWVMLDNVDENTTYSADNSTLQLSDTTFSIKDKGVSSAKIADDAITLDTIDASIFGNAAGYVAEGNHTHGLDDVDVIGITSATDLNNLKSTAKYWFSHTNSTSYVSNAPHTGYGGLLIVEEISSNTCCQIFYEYHGSFPQIWYRIFNSSWSTWTRIDGLNKSDSSHGHGNILSDGKIGSTANKPLITTTGGEVTTGSFGTAANTFCQGNDSRLSNARTPTAHTHPLNNITVTQINSVTDFNDLKTTAQYFVTHTNSTSYVSNAPHTGYGGLLIVETLASNTCCQTFYEYHGSFPHIWYRIYNGSWSDWTRIDGLNKADSNHSHGTWTRVKAYTVDGEVAEASNGYALEVKLFVNEELRLAQLRYYELIGGWVGGRLYGTDANPGVFKKYRGWIPEQYRPVYQQQGNFNYPGSIMISAVDGSISGRFAYDMSDSVDVYATVMWRY